MTLNPVPSSCLKAAGYDYETNTLYVQFTNGRTYKYYNVPKNVYDEMMTSLSRGSYLATRIAKAYNYSEVEEA